VNRAATSSVAVLSLAEAIQQSVVQKFGVELVIEPEVLGVSGDSVK